MRKLNKQDFIFIWTALLLIVVTFILYLMARVYFVDTCDLPVSHEKWYIWYALNTRYTQYCFWSWGFFDRDSHYVCILFLWLAIVWYMKKKYLLSNKKLFIPWIGVWVGIACIFMSILALVSKL